MTVSWTRPRDGDDAADGTAAARVAADDLDRHLVAVPRVALHAGRHQHVAPEAGAGAAERFDEAVAGTHARVAAGHRVRLRRGPTAPRRAPRRRPVALAQPLVARLADAAQVAARDGALEAGAQRLAVVAFHAEHAHHLGDGERPRRLLLQHARYGASGSAVAVGAHGER